MVRIIWFEEIPSICWEKNRANSTSREVFGFLQRCRGRRLSLPAQWHQLCGELRTAERPAGGFCPKNIPLFETLQVPRKWGNIPRTFGDVNNFWWVIIYSNGDVFPWFLQGLLDAFGCFWHFSPPQSAIYIICPAREYAPVLVPLAESLLNRKRCCWTIAVNMGPWIMAIFCSNGL